MKAWDENKGEQEEIGDSLVRPKKHLYLDDPKIRYLWNLNIFSEKFGSDVKFSQAQRTTSSPI